MSLKNNKNAYYIPHHAVFKESSTTTKLRVVFDASAKTSTGKSLNDVLMVGPVLQDDLFSLLIRFRTHQITLTADIEKMYRQIEICPGQRSLQRILWRNDTSEDVKIYELKTLTYGTASASFIATRVLKELANTERDTYPVSASILETDFYMDDLITGAETVEEARNIAIQLTQILRKGGFNLRKWKSNEPKAISMFEPSGLNTQTASLDKTREDSILGVQYDDKSDMILFKTLQMAVNQPTKRILLSNIARIFDPLGLIGPVVTSAKILMQKIWQTKIDWDEYLPVDISTKWHSIEEQLPLLEHIHVRRKVIAHPECKLELHCFCDASTLAYGACVYIRSIHPDGQSKTSLLCSKSRVAPIREISLPRLELCAAVLAAQLVERVMITFPYAIASKHYYSDSTITLSWINSQSRKWKTFVANRVGDIHERTKINEWHHVNTKENPADVISRGLMPFQLIKSSIWWKGPQWLYTNEATPIEKWDILPIDRLPELKTLVCTHIEEVADEFVSKFEPLPKLIRITAWCRRFIKNARYSESRFKGPLQVEDWNGAMSVIVSLVQKQSFASEIKDLKNNKLIHHASKLRTLNPFLDEAGIIRVGGRLRHSNLAYSSKFPAILPADHHFTTLIIRHSHVTNMHGGVLMTMAATRDRFWILSARRTIRKIIRKCIVCFMMKPRNSQPIMGDLPSCRVTAQIRPFIKAGVDYCGPFMIKQGRRSKIHIKSYAAIFVCMSTKAVHIELVCELTTEAFLNALRRFIARRGMVSEIHSDNATNFVGAEKELQNLRNLYGQQEMENFLIEREIKWKFIPARAPHFGGLWEAAVKSTKHHLRRIAGNANLTYEELNTLFIQIEAILNSRPITTLSDDPNDQEHFTPSHFLIGSNIRSFPEPDVKDLPLNRLSRWQRIEQLKQHFWTRWSKEYLSELQKRSKWAISKGNPIKPGQLAVIKEDNLPPYRWKTGRIEEIHPGPDGIIRAATMRVGKELLKRATNRLCILPINNEDDVES